MERLFPTGVPVLGKDLAGRHKEKERVKQLLKSGQSVVLFGPRRIGKTSLALTVLDELKKEKFFVGHVDVFESATLPIFSQRMVETVLANKKLAKTIRALKDGLSTAISKIEIKNVVNDFEWILKFAEKDAEAYDLFSNALDFPEQFAKKHRRHMVLFIDEIGDIDKFNGTEFIKLMRSKFQLHSHVTYLFAGSHESVVKNVFIKKSGVFYRFAQLCGVAAIEKVSFKAFLKNKFKEVNLDVRETALDAVLELTEGHPYYTQLLCRELYFYALSKGKPIDSEAVEIAIDEVIRIEELYFSTLWEEVSKNSAQVTVLLAIVENRGSLFHSDLKKKINVTRTLTQLKKRGIVEKNENNRYEFTDPLFKEYIKVRLL
ncbi:MAG: ATP-binding protein [Candidatus Aminicenantes bacterium]|nr:ATP-binding protein [Candidatus Aminicenantes bacterium]